jgi:hypothetical protein
MPLMYASLRASENTLSTFLEKMVASWACELYAATVLNALSFSSAVYKVNYTLHTLMSMVAEGQADSP